MIRSFQINRDAIADLKRPEIDQYADVKARVALLESIVVFQDRINPLHTALSDDLNVDLFKIEAKILEAVALNQNKAARDMEELRRHYDHR